METQKQSPIGERQSKMFPVNGALIIDKPAGITSHDVVARVRKIVREPRIGHTGTLDPFATGVLVLLLGRATRLAQFLSGAEKEYEAVIRLGYATETGDATGNRVTHFTTDAPRNTEFHREEIEAAMASLRGEIEQIPPMYSAKKIAGKKLYELARRGEQIERAAVRVNIKTFDSLPERDGFLPQNQDDTHDLHVRIVCSAGTYVRTLAEDLGERLGVGAHLADLRRTRAGEFCIAKAITLEQLDALMTSDSIEDMLIPPDAALSHLPAIELNADEATRALHGVDVPTDPATPSDWVPNQPVRMRNAEGELMAVGVYDSQRKLLHPAVVLVS